ncbi:MAG: DUF2130 domain-containing protein [bacterium]
MTDSEQNIKCPKCGWDIDIDDILKEQMELKVRKELSSEQQKLKDELEQTNRLLATRESEIEKEKTKIELEAEIKYAEKIENYRLELKKELSIEAKKELELEKHNFEQLILEKNEKLEKAQESEIELRKEKTRLEEEKIKIELEVEKKYAEKTEAYRLELKKELADETQKELELEKRSFQEQMNEKDEKLRKAQEKELELRKQKITLEEDKQSFELEKMRQLDEERQKIQEEAGRKAEEQQHKKIAELEMKLSNVSRAKDDLARKLEQGSMQTQGEVQELELEQVLTDAFPFDAIAPVPKGVNGADVVQLVQNKAGALCGKIAWESKQTKSWSAGWVDKLKEDMRAIKADIGVIVTAAMPGDAHGFVQIEKIWVCELKYAIALATVLRKGLVDVYREKALAVNKNDKMDYLYTYLTGNEFKQRVEAIVEAFGAMESGIRKERNAFEKIWCEREKQLSRVLTNTVGMYGDIGGHIALPEIKALELPGGDDFQKPVTEVEKTVVSVEEEKAIQSSEEKILRAIFSGNTKGVEDRSDEEPVVEHIDEESETFLEVGDLISHPDFGIGEVEGISDDEIRVSFKDTGIKMLSADYAKKNVKILDKK